MAQWDAVRAEVERRIAPAWRRTLEGETDSERCFLLFLTHLERRAGDIEADDLPFEAVAFALAGTVAELRALADPGAKRPSV